MSEEYAVLLVRLRFSGAHEVTIRSWVLAQGEKPGHTYLAQLKSTVEWYENRNN